MLSPAIPIVASEFNALSQIGWVSGAYYMTQCGSMLLFGQCSQIFDTKYVMIVGIFIFMLGSAISGGANNTMTLIIGRAVAGIGSAACYIVVQTLVAFLVELKYRPLMFGLFGLQNAVSGTVGPIIAGAFADGGLWRLCFLIVLPLGAITILLNLIVMPSVPPLAVSSEMVNKVDRAASVITFGSVSKIQKNYVRQILMADWLGFCVVTASLICFVLVMSWGGGDYAWGSSQVIGTFIGFVAIFVLFIYLETVVPWPLMPLRAWKNRTLIGGCIMSFFCFLCNLTCAVYVPVLYEAGYGTSSLQAGIHFIPYLMSVILCQLSESAIMGYTKSYWYWAWTSPCLIAVGAGLLFTVDINTTNARLIGYQIVYGMGIGFTQGVSIIAVQADNKPEDVPAALSTLAFIQLFGGVCGPVIGSAILDHGLRKFLPLYGVDSKTTAAVMDSVDTIWDLTGDLRTQVVKAYLKSLNYVFVMPMGLSAIVICGGLIIRNKSLKGLEVEI